MGVNTWSMTFLATEDCDRVRVTRGGVEDPSGMTTLGMTTEEVETAFRRLLGFSAKKKNIIF